ncbi:MAG: hypothetical protein KJ077_41380 [Anaerolineae bacterium]|nr:hypothetical protein [Anaerolineae bacterium]
MEFQRGTYGEILLTPLTADMSLEEALQEMVGKEMYQKMTSGEREAWCDEAIHSIHRQNLQRVLSGEVAGNAKAMVLYRAVMRGEPLNLYPIGLKRKNFNSFTPILRRVGDEQWQLGLPETGRYAILMGRVTLVLRQVWQLYLEWMEAEDVGDEA